MRVMVKRQSPMKMGLLAMLVAVALVGGESWSSTSTWPRWGASAPESPGQAQESAPSGPLVSIEDLLDHHAITIEWVDRFDGPNGAIQTGQSSGSGVIKVKTGRSPEATNVTILHEIAHELHVGEQHSQVWCDAYLDLLVDFMPEAVADQTWIVEARYDCH